MARTPTVLLIDDDEFVRQTLSAQLRGLGVERIEAAADGATALASLASGRRYDLVIADLMLPGMDGVELLRRAELRPPETALLLISSAEQSVLRTVAVLSRQRGLRVLGAVRKPVRSEVLAELLEVLAAGVPEAAAPADRDWLDAESLEQTLARGDIVLRATPCVSLHDGSLRCIEFRAQLRRPSTRPVGHERLHAAMQRHGFSERYTAYLVNAAIEAAGDCWRRGVQAPVSITLQGSALRRLDLPDMLQQRLRQADVLPNLFGVGIPEPELGDDCAALDVLARLRMRDIRVRIDDFSSSHCSFARLQRIPACEVRLDRSLLGGHRVGTRRLEHAVQTAQHLELDCIADDVATAEQLETVEKLGCIAAQGDLYGTDLDAEDLVDWSRSQRSRHGRRSAHARLN